MRSLRLELKADDPFLLASTSILATGLEFIWEKKENQEDDFSLQYEIRAYQCEKNSEAGQALLRCVQSYDKSLTEVRSSRLEIKADDPFLFASTSILATGLKFIWE